MTNNNKYFCYGYNRETNTKELLLEAENKKELLSKVKALTELLSKNIKIYILTRDKKELVINEIQVLDKNKKKIS